MLSSKKKILINITQSFDKELFICFDKLSSLLTTLRSEASEGCWVTETADVARKFHAAVADM